MPIRGKGRCNALTYARGLISIIYTAGCREPVMTSLAGRCLGRFFAEPKTAACPPRCFLLRSAGVMHLAAWTSYLRPAVIGFGCLIRIGDVPSRLNEYCCVLKEALSFALNCTMAACFNASCRIFASSAERLWIGVMYVVVPPGVLYVVAATRPRYRKNLLSVAQSSAVNATS